MIRTVLGDVDAAELGVVDAHDHLFFRTPLLPGQELGDELTTKILVDNPARAFAFA